MSLTITAGHATRCGLRARNEDFVGMVTPAEPDLSAKGVLAAVADGVSGYEGGREAAEYTVRGLLADYYATPDTWPVAQALDRVLKAVNSWVQHEGSVRPALAGMATTLTCLVLRGTCYYFSHVGDTRLYLLRDGFLARLTSDHVWDRPEMEHVLTRAIGLDTRLSIDHGMGPIRANDVFLLVSDGVWGSVSEYELGFQLGRLGRGELDGDACANALLDAALHGGSCDNLSALVMQVRTLPLQDLRDSLSSMQHLPLPPRLRAGQRFEGLLVERELHVSPSTLLYRVREEGALGRQLVLKTLQPARAGDERERAAFAHEEWLARRAVARFFPQVIASAQKNHLYYLSTWHEGCTLQERLDAGYHFTVPELLALAEQLVRAVGALHRRSIIHRDIKPANVHLGLDGQLRLLDLGVAQSGLDGGDPAPRAGTPSFLAPEQFDNAPASVQTDLYAVGVTLSLALTRRYPYGEIEAFQHPRFGEPVSATRYRPDLPGWLDSVLHKALAREPRERFESADEFLLALERGATRPLPARAPLPLARRNPAGMWRAIALASVLLNLFLLYLLA